MDVYSPQTLGGNGPVVKTPSAAPAEIPVWSASLTADSSQSPVTPVPTHHVVSMRIHINSGAQTHTHGTQFHLS